MGAIILGSALAVMLVFNLALSRTPYWFFQPWIGPLAKQNLKLCRVLELDDAGDVVILGDSRARHDFVSTVMEEELAGLGSPRVVNLGLDAAQSIGVHEIAVRLAGLSRRPKVVVVGTAPFTINAHNPRFARDLRLYASPATMAWGALYCPDWDQKLGAAQGLTRGLETLFQLLDLDRRSRPASISEFTDSSAYLNPVTPRAQAINRMAQTYREEGGRRKAYKREVQRYREMMREFETSDFTDSIFRRTLRAIKDSGALPIVALTPESASFRREVEGLGEAKSSAYYALACREEGVLLVDMNGPDWAPEDEAFFDYSVHLGPEGALELSRRFALEVLAPALSSQVP